MDFPVTLECRAVNKGLGCLSYVLAAPVLILILASLIAVPIALALDANDVAKEVRTGVLLAGLSVAVICVSAWCCRNYRRRASLRIVIHRDRIFVFRNGQEQTIHFTDVESVRLIRAEAGGVGCVLTMKSGRSLELDPLVGPCAILQQPLGETLIWELAQRAEMQLEIGASLEIRDNRAAARWRLLAGICLIAIGVLLILTVINAIWGVPVTIAGRALYVRGKLGIGGGFTLDRSGVCSGHGQNESWAAWQDLNLVRNDHHGLLLESTGGERCSASLFAENYWIAAVLVQRYLARS